jgi:hypothetical protein
MSTQLLSKWAGLISIVWMAGVHEFLNRAPEGFFLFKFDPSSWVTQVGFLGVWLGLGLLLALRGLRCTQSSGQVLAIIATGVFVYYAWGELVPAAVLAA